MLLEVEGLCVNYGHIEAIRGITFGVEEGTIGTLIGANGAGKSTTLKTLSGVRKVRAGKVIFDGQDITHAPPFGRVQMGISQSPEGRGIFVGMSVRENLDMGDLRPQGPQEPRRSRTTWTGCSTSSPG